MSINFQEILKELEYRVEHGIIDLTKEEQVTKLAQILKENGVSDANEMAQKARVYFSYLNEDDVVKNRKTGNIYVVKNFDSKKHDKHTPKEIEKAKAANGGKLPTTDKSTTGKPPAKVGAQKTAPAANIKVSDAEKKAAAKGRNPQEIKKEIDRISIEAGQSRQMFYKKGYHKAENEDDAGSAPGNAGSMLNENGSCDVCEYALENDKYDLVSAVSHLYDNLKGGALLEATDKTGIAGQEKSVPSVNAKQLRDFRAEGKGKFDKLSDGQLSRLMMAANGGLIKAKKIKE
jgi:hypothetical protein